MTAVPGKLKKVWARVRGVVQGMALSPAYRIPEPQPVPVRVNNRQK